VSPKRESLEEVGVVRLADLVAAAPQLMISRSYTTKGESRSHAGA
jgi:hypothetical protein